MSETQYNHELSKIKTRNESIRRKRALKDEKNKYKRKFKLPSTSKLMAAYLFLFLNVVVIFAMVAMWHFSDLTYLGVLVTDLAAQILVYLIYSVKATRENIKGGITYALALRDSGQSSPIIQREPDNSDEIAG